VRRPEYHFGGPALLSKARLLGVCLAFFSILLSGAPTSASTTRTTVTQREALQQQLDALGAAKAQKLQELLAAEEAAKNQQNEVQHNAVVLADLNRQQSLLRGQIAADESDLVSKRKLLAELTRDEYKLRSNGVALDYLARATGFADFINRVIALGKISNSVADTTSDIARQEQQLRQDLRDLGQKRAAAISLQKQLQRENGRLLAIVAQRDAEVNALDARSKGLYRQIYAVDYQLNPGGAVSGGGPCGNHFDYGYCTWYVATRRCIPWFGNADEWYANARAYGYQEGREPRPGAVAVWGAGRGYSGYGHVALVESVQPDGFTVSEYNYTYGWNRYDQRFVSYSGEGPLEGFVYGR